MPEHQWDIQQLRFRPAVVWSFAVSSLRVRMARAAITTLTIATAAAFMMFLIVSPREGSGTSEGQTWGLMLALSLVVAGVGVLNTMLMNVSQRYREIGTFKCLGALDRMILLSVLVEASLLGAAGAAIGVVAGLLLAVALSWLDGSLSEMTLGGTLAGGVLVIAITAALTTLSASVPAWLASRMPPVEAMRGEK